jgi:hypothetical protein
MKRTKLKKQSKQPISLIQRKLWDECKRIIRERHGNTCYTCGSTGLSGSNWHTGHLWAKASLPASLKYDLRVLRPQCYKCNIHYGGNGAIFYKKMVNELGQAYMDSLEKERQVLVKAYDFYVGLLEKYKLM